MSCSIKCVRNFNQASSSNLTNHVVITNKILDLLTIEKRMTGSQQNGMYCGSSLREKIGEYLHIILIFTKIFCPEENGKCTQEVQYQFLRYVVTVVTATNFYN